MTLLVELLKSELKLCPAYDELVGMIESQSGPNRPSTKTMTEELHYFAIISLVVNQMMWVLRFKIQEDRLKEEMRQTQLRQTETAIGT